MDNIVTTVGDTGITGRGQITQGEDGLTAPANIVLDINSARTYYENYRKSHSSRIAMYAVVKGLIGGNPPYDQQQLDEAGLGYIANVNTLDAKGLFERAALTFWNLLNQSEKLVVFGIRKQELPGQDLDFTTWSEILARNWTEVVQERWPDFVTQVNLLTAQLVQFGLSPVAWPDERDFRWKTVDLSRFYVADDTPVTVEDWDCVCIETSVTVQYLWSVYQTYKSKNDSPWDIDALEQYLVQKANLINKQSNASMLNALDVQTSLENNNLSTANYFTDSVRLVSLYYKEYSGKISHYMFDPRLDTVQAFLFKVSEQYDSFHEALVVFTYSPGEMKLHGNRGVGHKILPVCQAMMQLDCHMLDMSKMASTPIIQSVATVGKDIAQIRFIPGAVTDIGTATLQANNLGANVGQLVSVAQYMEQKVNRNAAISGDDPGVPDVDRGSKSAPEVQIQSIKEFGVGKQNVAHFYKSMDIVYRQMVAKMMHSKEGYPGHEIVEEWKELCISEGVPSQIFELGDTVKGKIPKIMKVRAARAAGDGSNLGMIVGLNGIAGIAGGLGAKGQFNYRKDIIMSRLGVDYADRYLSDSQTPDEAAGGASLAQLENIAMRMGEMPQATQDNQHKSHIGSHFAVLKQTIEAVQSQEKDPVEADKIFAMVLSHTGEHIDYLSQDELNRGYIEQIMPTWKQMQKFAQLNRVKAQKMQQAEVRRRSEAEQELTTEQIEQQREDFKLQKDEARKDFKVKSQVERAKDASETRADIMKRTVDKKAENERRAIELKAQNEGSTVNVKKPEEILANTSTAELQDNLRTQIGATPNPADFK